jgi:hypothetical protein
MAARLHSWIERGQVDIGTHAEVWMVECAKDPEVFAP